MTKSNWRDELYLGEVTGTVGKTVTKKIVRQGIKIGGKRGGRAAQGAVASGKTATQHAMQKKEAGKGEKIGKVVGGIAGGITGGALGAPLGGVGAIGTGIAGGEVGERLGGAIGKKFDKKEAKKKKPVGITTDVKKEETLLYDVVHDYIIAEDFASDTEGANKVILKLSDELMQEIYERTMTASEKRKDTMLKKKYDDSDMKKNMQAQYGKEEGKKVYFATIRKQAMEGYKGTMDMSKSHPEAVKKLEKKIADYAKKNPRVPGGKMGVKEEVKTIPPTKPTPTKPLSNGQGTFDKDMNYIPPGFENAKTIDKILPTKNNKGKKTEVVGEAKYEKGASDYGKTSIRNKRAFGKGGNARPPEERGAAKMLRHDAHQKRRFVKKNNKYGATNKPPVYGAPSDEFKKNRYVTKEEVGITTHSMMMKDKAKKEAMLRMKERDAVLKKLRKEERDEYGDPVGGPKISKKEKEKNLKKNTPDEQHTTTTSEERKLPELVYKDGKPGMSVHRHPDSPKGAISKVKGSEIKPNPAFSISSDEVKKFAGSLRKNTMQQEGYGSDRVGPALKVARVIDRVNPRPKPNSKRTRVSRALKLASIKKDEKIRKREENPYSADKRLKMVATSIRDRVKQKAKAMTTREDYIPEEGYDIARDMGRVKPSKDKKDGTTMPPSAETKKTQKVNKGPSAFDRVKKKYGKAVMVVGKK